MSVTLLQENSFLFDPLAEFNKFDISNQIGINCVLKCIDKKLEMIDKIQHHILFLKGRTGSGKSSCLPSSLFKHLDLNKGEKRKIVVNVTEPRVILAKSISCDNCLYFDYLKYGINTGYHTGAGKTEIDGPSKLVYMTTEIFRVKLNNKSNLGDVVIVDECHDLDLPMITLLKQIKHYLMDNTIPIQRKPLFIFASATLNIELMVKYFFNNENGILNNNNKISENDIYKDGLMINHILGTRNYPVEEKYISKEDEMRFKNDESEFVKFILNEGIEESIKSKENWKGLPARDILIFSYGTGFNKLFSKKYIKNSEGGVEIDKNDKDKNDNKDNDKVLKNNKDDDETKNDKDDDKVLKNNKNEIDKENDNILKGGNKDENDDYFDNELNNIDNELNETFKKFNETQTNLNETLDGGNENNNKIDKSKNSITSNSKNENNNSITFKYPIYISSMTVNDEEEVKKWRQRNKGKFRVLILPYGSTCKGFAAKLLLNPFDTDEDSQQHEIKIYISTNVLETGKTVNTWYQVFDTGLRASKILNPLTFTAHPKPIKLIRHPITQSASIQRCGRVGRKCPGISWRVFSEDAYNNLEENALPENINLISISQTILSCRNDDSKCDAVKDNDYISPTSFDTNLVSSRDLVNSGYCTPWGEYISDVRDYTEPAASWILKAEEQYYIEGKNLIDALTECRISRQGISDLMSMESYQIKEINENDISENDISAIYDAHSEYVKYEVGRSRIFKNIMYK